MTDRELHQTGRAASSAGATALVAALALVSLPLIVIGLIYFTVGVGLLFHHGVRTST